MIQRTGMILMLAPIAGVNFSIIENTIIFWIFTTLFAFGSMLYLNIKVK